jgi:small-conductance mechanosensitive channel
MGSLLKSVATGIILSIVVVMVLAELGADIAPIIASAGIIGVAFGFGAQNLVKDFLAGIFMILEDQYGVGDVVDLGEASGVVEAVGLRVTRLRDVNGTVWYCRNGEVIRVGNQSQNWARTVLDVTVSYEADLDQVQSILQAEATAMYEDPEFHDVIIEAPEVWGVERFDKDGAVVRVVLKTAPLQQWLVARAMRQRIKSRFDEAGIRIPTSFRTTTDGEPIQ